MHKYVAKKKTKIQDTVNSNQQLDNDVDKVVQLAEYKKDGGNLESVSNNDNNETISDKVEVVSEGDNIEVLHSEDVNSNEDTNRQNVIEDDSNENNHHEEVDSDDDVEKKKSDKLNVSQLFRILIRNWWVILLNCLIIGAIAALLIVEEPRTYTSSVILAPEAEDVNSGGALSSIASSFGVDLGGVTTADAIRPDLYPDLVASNDFIMSLFKIPVKTIDGNIYTDYFTYLKKYQKSSWWGKALNDLKKKFSDDDKKVELRNNKSNTTNNNSLILTKDQERLIESVRNKVVCSVDKRNYTISITVTDQDPLIAATVADSVKLKIQNFITEYRTKKATKDYHYYLGLLKQAKNEYEKSVKAYAAYVDTHRDVILQAYISERDQLENDMQLKLNAYNAMITQTQTAKAKIQENTPAFTILQNAYVPVKPTGPKRMIFVIAMVFVTFVFTTLAIVIKRFI